MEIKQEKLENYFIGAKRKTPFDNNVDATTTLLKKVKEEEEAVAPQNGAEEIEMKTDIEIMATISRMKNNLKSFGFKLRDGGEKLKASLRKYEDELQRRDKIKPPPVLAVNIPVSAEVEPDSLLISSPAPPPEPQQAANAYSVDSVQLSNGDKKDGASDIYSPDHGLAVNKPLSSSGSQHGVATSVPTADANMHDPWTDEMIQNILNEVVTVATESRGIKPSASGSDNRPPVTFLKGSSGVFVQQNQELDIELKKDSEIKETIAKLKLNLAAFGHRLHKGEKIKESILRYEHELQRRSKIKPPPVLSANIPVSAELEPKSLLLSTPVPLPEPQQSPNTHSVDSVQHMISNGDKRGGASDIYSPDRGLAVNKPLSSSGSQHGVATSVPTSDANIHDPWTDEIMQDILNEVVTVTTESKGRKPSASGNDNRPPVTFLKGSSGVFVQQNQEQDIELKTNSEIKETIARLKRNLVAFGHKLHDKGEKIKESIIRYEHELQRRNKIRPGVLPVNIPVSAQVNPTSQLLSPAPSPQECPQSPVTHLVDSVKQVVPNDGNKDGDSNLPSRDHVAGNKSSPFSGSQYGVGVGANGSTVNADKHDSLTDEKMLKIVHELVTVGIAHTEVGKAAEICYKDPVKAKVLFALPGNLRKSYVRGFLYPRK